MGQFCKAPKFLMPEEPEEKIPFWVKDTLPEHTYFLSLFQSADSCEEQIDLTRAEYIALKAHLAAMRGYTCRDFAARVDELVKAMDLPESRDMPSADPQQVACYLKIAREFYKLSPDLVVFESDELAEYLKKLAEG